MNSHRALVPLIAAYVLLARPAPAQQTEIIGIYSDLCWHRESGGDVLGDRFTIFHAGALDYAVAESAEGELGAPIIAKNTKIADGRIEFALPRDTLPGNGRADEVFTGTIDDQAITGSFSSPRTDRKGNKVLHLPRVPNGADADRFPECQD
jgi:hypothetical protein